ncbi:hypothetical protein [Helicobacter cetorum]|uniref:Signal-transducing protein, histidine kinase n=1 Tax=Helicobacter cetorum (strain ATCC BAA-540 / CCUG 52418 / MIT 99-5656) TaxID=1163745 RepID=I0EUL1_HELCM|nr:hypothetical protein [Helicobacter cetorum]AFI06630.1 hypothetical protein HCD_08230 [Helicobacter cetorum MIT 99-5656]
MPSCQSSFKKRFLSVYILSTLLLVVILLALFISYEKTNLLENTQIRMQYTANAITKSLIESDNTHSLNPLKILEEKFKNTPFVLLDTDNKIKFSNIGAFAISLKDEASMKIPYFVLKKQGFYLIDNAPSNHMGVSKIILVEEGFEKTFIPLYKITGFVFLSAILFIMLVARWLYKMRIK